MDSTHMARQSRASWPTASVGCREFPRPSQTRRQPRLTRSAPRLKRIGNPRATRDSRMGGMRIVAAVMSAERSMSSMRGQACYAGFMKRANDSGSVSAALDRYSSPTCMFGSHPRSSRADVLSRFAIIAGARAAGDPEHAAEPAGCVVRGSADPRSANAPILSRSAKIRSRISFIEECHRRDEGWHPLFEP